MRDSAQGNKKGSFTWNTATRTLLGSIRAYRTHISPLLRPRCRFTPTCSEYAIEAIGRHGAGKGLALSITRILRCNRLFKGGHDPVP